MKKYEIVITKQALSEMQELYDYIAFQLQAPDNAKDQYNRIAEKILSLDQMPERYKILDFEEEKIKEIRRMVVDNFSVFYIIRESTVTITNVFLQFLRHHHKTKTEQLR